MIKSNFKKGGKFLGFGTSPYTDWKIIFFTALLLILLAVVWSVYMYIKIDKGEIFVVESDSNIVERTINAEKLKATVDYYQEKSTEFERVRNAKETIADPSL